MTPYALYHSTSKAPGVILSPSKGGCGWGMEVFVVRRCFVQRTNIRCSWPRRPSYFCCAKSNQKARPCHQKCFFSHSPTAQSNKTTGCSILSPLIVRAGPTRQKVLLCPSLPRHPPPFCLILAEAVLLTARGQRFFTCLLKTLSLRGASQGLRVGRDVAIARYAFKPVSYPSLKSKNRVLIVSCVAIARVVSITQQFAAILLSFPKFAYMLFIAQPNSNQQ